MTTRSVGRLVAMLLVLSAVLLGILVPGGPIETRSFSHIATFVLAAFNTFLTTLGIGSLVFAYFALKGKRWAFVAAALCGIFYFLVYALDLGKIFPVSPEAMSPALYAIELIGILVSMPLTYLSFKSTLMLVGDKGGHVSAGAIKKTHLLLLALMVLTGIGIIIFATMSAMGK
jgi:hypothetical protein